MQIEKKRNDTFAVVIWIWWYHNNICCNITSVNPCYYQTKVIISHKKYLLTCIESLSLFKIAVRCFYCHNTLVYCIVTEHCVCESHGNDCLSTYYFSLKTSYWIRGFKKESVADINSKYAKILTRQKKNTVAPVKSFREQSGNAPSVFWYLSMLTVISLARSWWSNKIESLTQCWRSN